MLVLVRYNDEDYDIVEDYCLEYLIVSGKIMEFSRSDQWVKVGSAQTRESNLIDNCEVQQVYTGPERRKVRPANIMQTLHTSAIS